MIVGLQLCSMSIDTYILPDKTGCSIDAILRRRTWSPSHNWWALSPYFMGARQLWSMMKSSMDADESTTLLIAESYCILYCCV
jgi:hypothetical protein